MGTFKVHDIEHFLKAIDFAIAIKREAEFLENIRRMCAIAKNNEGSVVDLFNDFEPYSFVFNIETEKGVRILNGGLIYHGPLPDGTVGGNSSIQLLPSVGWSMHT